MNTMERTISIFTPLLEKPLLSVFRSQFHGEIEPNEALMKEKIYGDPHYDKNLAICLNEGDKFRAFAMGVLREVRGEKIGYIKLLLVDRKISHQGAAEILVERLENELIEKGAQRIRFFDAPMNYFFPGIPAMDTALICLAEKRGYTRFADTQNMTVQLVDESRLDSSKKEIQLAEQGIQIKRVSSIREIDSLMQFIDKDFALWRYEVTNSLSLNPKAVHIALKDQQVIAFSAYEGNNKGTGWFGPMGTSEVCRGLGIGGVLLKRCLIDLKNKGFEKAIIPWVGPIGFYANQVGAKMSSIYWRYEKVIKDA